MKASIVNQTIIKLDVGATAGEVGWDDYVTLAKFFGLEFELFIVSSVAM